MSRRRRPRKTGDRTPAGVDQVLEVLADGLRVAEVMRRLDQRTEELLLARAPHLENPQRLDLSELGAKRCRVDVDVIGSRLSSSRQSLVRPSIPLRKSAGSIATRMRICGVSWIIVPGSRSSG